MNQFFLNPAARRGSFRGLFDDADYARVDHHFSTHPSDPTPLHRLTGLASAIGVKELFVKDESARLGLPAFKILGASYAIARLVEDRQLVPGARIVCATAGNHGRAVARAARSRGLQARIYLPKGCVPARAKAIASEGAEVVQTSVDYDEAVRLAAEEAEQNGWVIVSDTSWAGYDQIPRLIMAGYTRLFDEAAAQWAPGPPPDVVFVQAGVGGLLGAAASWMLHRFDEGRPLLASCEPAGAACVLESVRAGRPVTVVPAPTMMACLQCGEMSPAALEPIARGVDALVAVDDEWTARAMRRLASPHQADPPIRAGASGACGLAALLATLADDRLAALRSALQLDGSTRALVVNTEGATDPELHERITRTLEPR